MMKRLLMFCALFMVSGFVHASRHEQFLRAHALYDKHEYQEALAQYDAIENKNSAVWYNMGNCAYHMADYDTALLYWRKAERGAPAALQKYIVHNMKRVAQQVPDVKERHPSALAHHALKRYLMQFSLLFWQLIFLFVFVGFMAAAAHYMFQARGILLTILFCLVLIVGVLLYHRRTFFEHRYGIIMQETDLFVGPDKEFHKVAHIPSGSEVRIIEHRDGWHKVRYKNLVGWMFADTLAEV